MTDTPFSLFHNRLRIMLNIGKDELETALSASVSHEQWEAFRVSPWSWFIAADTPTAQKVFALIEAREAAWAARKMQISNAL